MTNPQCENGFTRIANELLEALARIRIPGEARQVLDVILRKTYGYHKIEDAISLSQFCLATGLKKVAVCKSVNKLSAMNLITQKGNGVLHIYRFNKDYGQWKPLPKKVTLPKKVINVTQKDNESLPKKITTIDKKEKRNPLYPPEGDGGCVLSSGDEVEVLQRMKKFWNAYPRKQGKEKLKNVWKEMSPSELLLETMLEVLEIQKKSSEWKRESGRFIPLPSKWLTERRWEDVVKTEQPSPAPEIKRETYTPEDLKRFDQARRKGVLDCKKKLGMGGERNANSGN